LGPLLRRLSQAHRDVVLQGLQRLATWIWGSFVGWSGVEGFEGIGQSDWERLCVVRKEHTSGRYTLEIAVYTAGFPTVFGCELRDVGVMQPTLWGRRDSFVGYVHVVKCSCATWKDGHNSVTLRCLQTVCYLQQLYNNYFVILASMSSPLLVGILQQHDPYVTISGSAPNNNNSYLRLLT
jgi:hypothetical protein